MRRKKKRSSNRRTSQSSVIYSGAVSSILQEGRCSSIVSFTIVSVSYKEDFHLDFIQVNRLISSMPISEKLRSRFRRLFRRERPPTNSSTYAYEHLMRFPRLPITVPPLVPTLMSYRCIDSLNTCFPQPKHKTSYDFCLRGGSPSVVAKRYDEDDCDVLPKKFLRDSHHHQHVVRRRLPKRFSDLVVPSNHKAHPTRTESLLHEKSVYPSAPPVLRHRSHQISSPNKVVSLSRLDLKSPSNAAHRYNQRNQRVSSNSSIDMLAQRMQAAMSTELMHSLDRNFVLTEKKTVLVNRSQSFNPGANSTKETRLMKPTSFQLIPRVKTNEFDDESKSSDTIRSLEEPTPDYDEENPAEVHGEDTDDEPTIDYEDSNEKIPSLSENKDDPSLSATLDELGFSASVIIAQASITPSPENNRTGTPPTPPPLPSIEIESKKIDGIRCRTIADRITPDHKLILKDQTETKMIVIEKKDNNSVFTKTNDLSRSMSSVNNPASSYFHVSRELLNKTNLRKVSHPVSRSFSSYGSMSQLNERETELTTIRERTSFVDEAIVDISLSSGTTSIVVENDHQTRSSTKVYNDYKRRASLISVPTSNTLKSSQSHSTIIHPMHTRIGFRSSTNSISSHDNKLDMHLSNKQMNVCVINQLNAHLSTRLRQHQTEFTLMKRKSVSDQKSYDEPPELTNTNVYDEPHLDQSQSIYQMNSSTSSLPPPPPPPLPVGGFRPSSIYVHQNSFSQRASTLTLPRDANGSEFSSNTGTSTMSSKLSDMRILRELQANPLFAKAKEHLELECNSPNRKFDRQNNESKSNDSLSYVRLKEKSDDHRQLPSKTTLGKAETFLIKNEELNAVLAQSTKRSRSMNSTKAELVSNQRRPNTKLFLPPQSRQSELELVFQKRAQRSEQSLK